MQIHPLSANKYAKSAHIYTMSKKKKNKKYVFFKKGCKKGVVSVD